MALVSTFFQMFIVLGMYNFGCGLEHYYREESEYNFELLGIKECIDCLFPIGRSDWSFNLFYYQDAWPLGLAGVSNEQKLFNLFITFIIIYKTWGHVSSAATYYDYFLNCLAVTPPSDNENLIDFPCIPSFKLCCCIQATEARYNKIFLSTTFSK